MNHRIIIQKVNTPKKNDLKDELRFICDSLGFVNGRDTEDTSFKIMCELLDQLSGEKLVATEELSKSLNIEGPTINHHIRGFMESGIIFREKRKIAINGGSLTAAIEEMRRETDSLFERITEVSKRIDKRIGF